MAFTKFDLDRNSITQISGDHYIESTDSLEKVDISGVENIKLLKEKNSCNIIGLEYQHFFSKPEIKGLRTEQLFKNYLDDNEIPCLYIGQGLNGIEQSVVIKDKSSSKRPDFLVSLPNLGTVFFDVKCRKRIGFNDSKEKFFYLKENDILTLNNLQKELLIPVWAAFLDEEAAFKKQNVKFHICPISVLYKYLIEIQNKIESIRDKILLYLIPNELLFELTKKFTITLESRDIAKETLEKYSNLHLKRIRFISQVVYNKIEKSEQVLKKEVLDSIIQEHGNYIVRNEWDFFIKNDDQIIYKPYEPLKLR